MSKLTKDQENKIALIRTANELNIAMTHACQAIRDEQPVDPEVLSKICQNIQATQKRLEEFRGKQ